MVRGKVWIDSPLDFWGLRGRTEGYVHRMYVISVGEAHRRSLPRRLQLGHADRCSLARLATLLYLFWQALQAEAA